MLKCAQFPSVVFILSLVLPQCAAKDLEYTVKIPAADKSCFYHTVDDADGSKDFELEFQVIEGGDLDVNVLVHGPGGQVLLSADKKSDGVHKIKPLEAGDHRICFDNTFSHFTQKLVFFAIIDDVRGVSDEEWMRIGNEGLDLDMKVEDIRTGVDNVRHNLERTIQLQNMMRVTEARDRAQQEANFDRVNNWSCFQMIIMLGVAATQIFLIRSLFEEKSRLNKFLKSRS